MDEIDKQYTPQEKHKPDEREYVGDKKTYSAQEAYNLAEKNYLEARIKFDDDKTAYELNKAKTHTILKTKALACDEKLTITDLKYKILVQQANPETDLGKAFVTYGAALAKKKRMYVEMKIAERAYWNSIKNIT